MRLYIAAVLCVIVSARLVGQEVVLQQLQVVAAMQPIVVEHGEGDQLSVMEVGVGDLPEQQYRRFSTHTVFVAKGGDYLIRLGDKFGVIRIASEASETSSMLSSPPEKPIQVWAYMGANCSPCESWKENELPLLRSRPDVDVYVVPPGQHDKLRTPTFIIKKGDKVVEREGYQSNWNTAADILK